MTTQIPMPRPPEIWSQAQRHAYAAAYADAYEAIARARPDDEGIAFAARGARTTARWIERLLIGGLECRMYREMGPRRRRRAEPEPDPEPGTVCECPHCACRAPAEVDEIGPRCQSCADTVENEGVRHCGRTLC